MAVNLTIEEKEKYLLMASYTAKDIMDLKGVQKSRASKIMAECRERYGGTIKFRPNACTSKSFWLREGTTLEEEYRLLGISKGYVRNEELQNTKV